MSDYNAVKTFFDPKINMRDFYKLHPSLFHMIGWTSHWCWKVSIQCYFTSLYRPENDGISKSKTHQEYRAADLSLLGVFGWTTDLVDRYHIDCYREFKNVGALIKSEGKLTPRPIYIHGVGSAYHAHLQVRP